MISSLLKDADNLLARIGTNLKKRGVIDELLVDDICRLYNDKLWMKGSVLYAGFDDCILKCYSPLLTTALAHKTVRQGKMMKKASAIIGHSVFFYSHVIDDLGDDFAEVMETVKVNLQKFPTPQAAFDDAICQYNNEKTANIKCEKEEIRKRKELQELAKTPEEHDYDLGLAFIKEFGSSPYSERMPISKAIYQCLDTINFYVKGYEQKQEQERFYRSGEVITI